MNPAAGLNLASTQAERCFRFSAAAAVDIHCHCLPGLDDGPATLADAIALCRALVEDGITDAVATPHELDTFGDQQNYAADIRTAVTALSASLAAEKIPLRLHAGGDVRVDDRLLTLLDADRICTLADGRAFLLLELPHKTVIDLSRLIADLSSRGITGILSHPERHQTLMCQPELLTRWAVAGLLLQITAGSLLGQFGSHALDASWQLIDSGLATLVAGDAHDVVHRPPSMTAAIAAVTAKKGYVVARRLCVENPLRVLRGDRNAFARPAARPVVTVRRRRWWERAS